MKKKLKRVPADLEPYIQIEAESVRDVNDKMITSSNNQPIIDIQYPKGYEG